METKSKVPLLNKVAYGIGTGGGCVFNQIAAAFLLNYYTDTALISATAIATMFLVCRIFDGISDFIMGGIVDKTNTKLGNVGYFLVDVGELGVGAQFTLPDVPELIQQRLEEFSTMERQLVVQTQGGSGEGRFGDLGDGAQVFAVVMAVADPVDYPPCHLPTADTAAMSAEDVPGEGRAGRRGTPVEPLLPGRDSCPLSACIRHYFPRRGRLPEPRLAGPHMGVSPREDRSRRPPCVIPVAGAGTGRTYPPAGINALQPAMG